jgi:curved DNA-binding protein CbpA
MATPYEQLGVTSNATPEQIKAAYHAKLKEFPAHSHPQEFKSIRAAYDAIRKGEATQSDNFLMVRPLEATLDQELLNQLRSKAIAQFEISLEELLKETF